MIKRLFFVINAVIFICGGFAPVLIFMIFEELIVWIATGKNWKSGYVSIVIRYSNWLEKW